MGLMRKKHFIYIIVSALILFAGILIAVNAASNSTLPSLSVQRNQKGEYVVVPQNLPQGNYIYVYTLYGDEAYAGLLDYEITDSSTGTVSFKGGKWENICNTVYVKVFFWNETEVVDSVLNSVKTSFKPIPSKRNISVPILMYHHISNCDEEDKEVISAKTFKSHMEALKGYCNPISLKQFVDYIDCADGSVTLPENPVVITFDDGYESNYTTAFPILKEFEIPAAIFMVTGSVGERAENGKVKVSHFTWDEAREMEQSGLIDIQSHTHTHADIAALDEKSMRYELGESKRLIEENLNKVCDVLALPYGSCSQTVLSEAEADGYKVILLSEQSEEEGIAANQSVNGYKGLKRITVSGRMQSSELIRLIFEATGN